MEKRSYKKFTEVYSELKDFCSELARQGGCKIPHERELAAELNTSRMTLRKAIALAVKQGILIRCGRFLQLSGGSTDISNLGRVLFVSSGVDDRFFLYSFKQLYLRLKPALKSMNLDLELLLTNRESSGEDILKRCMESDIILLTIAMCRPDSCNLTRLFQEVSGKRKLIALSDPFYEHLQNFIALDNEAVGMLAAQTLLDAGCRRMCSLDSHRKSTIFRKREDSFAEAVRRSGAELVTIAEADETMDRASRTIDAFQAAIEAGCDGVFLLSDEVISIVMEHFFKSGVIPEKVKLVTVNGCGQALHYLPKVCCVSHGIREVASALAAYLVRLSRNPEWPCCRKLVKPRLFPGETI